MADDQRPVTIVTGGSRGIGAATVAHLARAGHDLAVGYRDDHDAAMHVVSMATTEGARCIAVRADVTREDDVQDPGQRRGAGHRAHGHPRGGGPARPS